MTPEELAAVNAETALAGIRDDDAPLQRVWDALEARDCRPHGTLWDFRACCPGHDGHNDTALSVCAGADGRAVLHCFTSCDTKTVVDALGLDLPDLFPDGHRDARRRTLQFTPEERARLDRVNGNGSAIAAGLLIDMSKVDDEPPEYLIDPLAARGYLTLLPGKRGSFKSFLTLVLANCCHTGGGSLAGIRCASARALIVDAENGARLMRRRFTVAGVDVKNAPLIADGTKLHLPEHIELLRALILHVAADLVILDSLRRLTPGLDEDSSRDMAPVLAALANLAREMNVAIVLLHHQSSKPGAPPSRGSSAIEDQADVVMRLTRYKHRRLKLWVGSDGKFRIDEEPAAVWLTFGWEGGRFTLGTTDAAPDDDSDEDPGPSPRELLGDAVLTWARREIVTCQPLGNLNNWQGDKPAWRGSELARAVGREPTDKSVWRALDDLEIKGQLERGEDKRWRPTPTLLDAVFATTEEGDV
jgi:hypothetical protein